MRKTAGGTLRMDVVMYCLAALRLFKNDLELCKKVTFEIALLGQGGLAINNPDKKYRLKSLDGEFNAMQLVRRCIHHHARPRRRHRPVGGVQGRQVAVRREIENIQGYRKNLDVAERFLEKAHDLEQRGQRCSRKYDVHDS